MAILARMSLQLDFSADPSYVWDSPEKVIFQSVASPPGRPALPSQNYEIDVAIRAQVTDAELASSGGVYVKQDLHWFIPGALLQIQPKIGDMLSPVAGGGGGASTTGAGRVILPALWTVLDWSWETLDQVYDLTCRNFALVYQLQDTVSILTPQNRQDAALSRVLAGGDYLPKFGPFAARIQETAAETKDERGRRLQVKTFDVFCGQRVDMTNEDVLEDPRTGLRYEFVSSESPDRIDQLQVLKVRRAFDG